VNRVPFAFRLEELPTAPARIAPRAAFFLHTVDRFFKLARKPIS
jgi:hypothetical protein